MLDIMFQFVEMGFFMYKEFKKTFQALQVFNFHVPQSYIHLLFVILRTVFMSIANFDYCAHISYLLVL